MVPDLDSINNEVNRITESIDKHFKAVASSLLEYPIASSIRESIQSSPWIYERTGSTPPPSPPRQALPVGYLKAAQRWVSEHRAVTAAVVAFIGTGVFVIWRQRRADRMKRRAKRAKNGSRTEVVILAGSPHSPLTKSLSLELDRRGFIVYIPVNSLSEEHVVQSEGRPDIRSLHLDVTSEHSTTTAVSKFTSYITTPQHPLPHTPAHSLQLSSLVLLPPLKPSAAPITTLSAAAWSDTLNVNVIAPFALLQAFLPLLVSQKSTLLALTSSIVPSLKAASHAPESVTARADHPDWTAAARAQYLKEHIAKLTQERASGSSPRELHNTVFDAIIRGKGRGGTVFVGRGAWTYDLIGRWVPGGVVGWMMGSKRSSGFGSGDVKPSEGSQEWEKVEHA